MPTIENIPTRTTFQEIDDLTKKLNTSEEKLKHVTEELEKSIKYSEYLASHIDLIYKRLDETPYKITKEEIRKFKLNPIEKEDDSQFEDDFDE